MRFLRSFLGIAGIAAEVVDADGEAPDFLVKAEGCLVGVEVREVFVEHDHGPILPKAAESIVDRVVADARRLYESRGGKPVHISIGFSTGGDLRALDRRAAAHALADYLIALDPPLDEYISWKPPLEGSSLPPQLSFMNILAVPSWGMAHWGSPKAGWVAPLTRETLQSSVDSKALKIHEYRKRSEKVWLLLVIEGRAPSQFFELPPDLHQFSLSSPFDRTYLLFSFGQKVYDVGPKESEFQS